MPTRLEHAESDFPLNLRSSRFPSHRVISPHSRIIGTTTTTTITAVAADTIAINCTIGNAQCSTNRVSARSFYAVSNTT